ncbi:MAG: Ger(x)C family spore germination protein [Clostridiales bacterium]|jgi:germination protein, ger(x)C family|nr:Ger(x)C family spore germination protein [Clostridiales bacterium]
MKKRQTCLLLCFICLLSFCGGCAHTKTKRELDSLAVVLGIAIDKAEEKDEIGSESFGEDSEKLLLTAQVVRNISISQNSSESESSGSGNEGDLGRPYWNVQVVGSNLLETLRSAIHITNRRLYVAHNQVVIISKDIAQQGIAKYLDYFFRDHETRYDVGIVISDGKAGEVLDVVSHLESFPAQDLKKLVERQKDDAHGPQCTLFSFIKDYKIPYKSTLVPIVRIITPEESDNKSPYLHIAGSAVFKDDKMVTSLDENQTRGALWVLGQVENGIIALDYEGANVAIEIIEGSGDFNVEYVDGRIKIKANAKMTGVLGELQGSRKVEPVVLRAIEKACAEEIESKIRSAFNEIQSNKADVLGIAERFYRYHYKTWKKIADDFDSLYENADLTVDVKTEIIRTGSLMEPADENGGESN